jgi:hypothetical protein
MEGKIHLRQKTRYPCEKHLDKLLKAKPFPCPTLKQIGFEEALFEIPPAKPDKEIIQHYDETQNLPYINDAIQLARICGSEQLVMPPLISEYSSPPNNRKNLTPT